MELEMKRKMEQELSQYHLIDVIGQGSFGQVYKARRKVHDGPQSIVAIKVINWNKLKQMNETDTHIPSNEIAMLKRLAHPYIITFYESISSPTAEYIVMEYAEHGDLLSYINAKSKLPERRAWRYFNHLSQALHHIHTLGYIHGDIKLENILICSGDVAKLTDLGFVTPWDPLTTMTFTKGSINYASPEILLHRPFYGPETDIWSLGIVLFAMVSGNLPLTITSCAKAEEAFNKFDARRYYSQLRVSHHLQDLLSRMHEINFSRRINLNSILQHPWVLTEPSLLTAKRASDHSSLEESVTLDPTVGPSESPHLKRIKEIKGSKGSKESKEIKGSKENKVTKETKETKESKGSRDIRSIWHRFRWLWPFN
jgi:serine/threonine protein kinase